MDALKGRKRWPDEKLLTRALSAKTSKAYWDNVHELRCRASASLYTKCMELVKSKLPAECVLGVDVLSDFIRRSKRRKYGYEHIYVKKIRKLFWEMLATEKNTDIIFSLLRGIGKTNSHYNKSQNIDLLLTFSCSENKNTRLASVFALSSIDDMKAIRGLIALTQDKYSHIRDWATFGIGTLCELDNDAIRNALYARCTDKHYDTRMEAIRGLAKRKDEGIKKYLEKELDDCTVYVLESIQDLNAKEYLPRLESMLEDAEKHPDVYSNEYWVGCLKTCVEELRRCQQDNNTSEPSNVLSVERYLR